MQGVGLVGFDADDLHVAGRELLDRILALTVDQPDAAHQEDDITLLLLEVSDAPSSPDNGIPKPAHKVRDLLSAQSGKVPPVGDTVNAATAEYTNSIGAAELSTVWTDPDFDPSERAFYYVRVLEIPTPRWSTRDAVRLGMPVPKGLPVSIQERAWTSPIWYTPAS